MTGKMFLSLLLAGTAWGVFAMDVSVGGAVFRLPEKGRGLTIVENGRADRMFINNVRFSDGGAQRPLAADVSQSNRIEKLEALPGRSAWRVTYPVEGSDAIRLSAVYRFLDGVPGVAMTVELTAVKPVRIHSWNVATAVGYESFADEREPSPHLRATRPGGRDFVYDAGFKVREGGIVYAPYPGGFAKTGQALAAGEALTFSCVAGRLARPSDAAAILRLEGRTAIDGRGEAVMAYRLDAPCGGGAPDWSAVPVSAVRGETIDYRPIASNRWNGPGDLSFVLKAAYDDDYLYLNIDVSDDLLANDYTGKNVWIGDAVQFAVDPLSQKSGQNMINFCVAAAGKAGNRSWCSEHAAREYAGRPVEGLVNRSRTRKGGVVYDLALPWKFFEPFQPKRGSFGFSFAVIDQDSETNYETWMGLADGVFGGRDASKYPALALEGLCAVKGNVVAAAPAASHSRDELLALYDRVKAAADALAAACARLDAAGRHDDYLSSSLEMARYFLDFERYDLDAKAVWKNYKEQSVSVTDTKRAYINDRFHFNLSYLETLLPSLAARAGEILAGTRAPERLPAYPKGERPQVVDGGFACGGRELLLFGPNTWLGTMTWTNDNDLATIARTGFNYFNLFYAREPRQTRLMEIAEREGLYCSLGTCTAERLTLDEDAWRTFWANVDAGRDGATFVRSPRYTPNLVFQCAFPEQFGRYYEKTSAWAEGFRRHLLAKFGSLAEINAVFGTSFAKLEEIDFAAALACPALKYESMGYRLAMHLAREREHLAFKKARFDGLPISGHYSTHYNVAGLDPLVTLADFEKIWAEMDVVGFDGGVGLENCAFAVNFAKGCLDVDLSRSLAPGKPIANNEDHIITDGTYYRYTEAETYLSNILTFLLGQNAASIWVWSARRHGEGEYAFTMANTYHATMRVALDLRQHPEEFASFRRTPEPPFRVLHSLPSLTDRDSYVQSLYALYEGVSFTGWAVRFLSERRAEAGDFGGAKIVLVPDARRVSAATFDALAAFAEKGGRVVAFGDEALLRDEYGRDVPARRAVCDRLFRREKATAAGEYAAVLSRELAAAGARPPVRISVDGRDDAFGVMWREGRTADGARTLFVANLRKAPVEVSVEGAWRDVLSGGDARKTLKLPVGGVALLRP